MEENKNIINEVQDTGDELTKATKNFSGLGWAFVIGSAVIMLVQTVAVRLVGMWKPEWTQDPTMALIIAILPMYLIGMPALILLAKRIPADKVEQRKMKAGHFILALIMCIAVMYVSNLVGSMITYIIGTLKGSAVNNTVANIASSANMAVTFIYMVICAPIMEEYVFRKLIVDRTVRYGQGVAVVVSGLMFGLFHGNLNQFVYAATMGMFLAFLYVKTGKLKITIAIHMIINFMGAVISVLVLDAIHYEEFVEVSYSGNLEATTAFITQHLLGFLAYYAYLFFIVIAMVVGIILFIVFRKRLIVEAGEVSIPKGKRFRTIVVNSGMIVYCIFWIGMIIYQTIL